MFEKTSKSGHLQPAPKSKALTRGRTDHFSKLRFSSRNHELLSTTLTLQLDLECIKLNQRAKYLCHRSTGSKVTFRTNTYFTFS